MTATATTYAMRRTVNLPLEETEARIRESLAAEGFGVLTEIDVRETLRKRLDIDTAPYRILGACNPTLAHQALETDRDIGLLLPCNLVVYEGDEPGTTVLAAIDPIVQLGVTGRKDLMKIAGEVKERLVRAVEAV